MACFVGANLPCGKLDRRAVIPAIARWCRGRPDGLVPANVSGHASVWRWACSADRAVHLGAAWQVDRRGFARETWKPLDVPHD